MTLDSIANRITVVFGDKETEKNWEKVDSLLKEFSNELIVPPDELISAVRKFKEVLQSSLATERTRLALTALELVQKIANHLALQYEGLQDYFLYQILRLCERTNKILSDRAKSCLISVMKYPVPLKTIMGRLIESKNSQNKTLRLCVVEALVVILQNAPKEYLADFEETLMKMIPDWLKDASEPVRATSRQLFSQFSIIFPSGAISIRDKLPPSVLKTLNLYSTTPNPPPSSIKTFIAKKFTTHVEPKSGPQRVATRINPPSHQPYPTAESSKLLSSKIAMRVTKPTNLTTLSTSTSNLTDKTPIHSRLSSSFSVGSLPIIQPSKISCPHSTSTDNLPKLLDSTPASYVFATPNYRRLVGNFKEKLRRSIAWDVRCATINEFIEVMSRKEFSAEIVNSKASKLDLFDIFLAGLLDIHHKVVFASLYFGRKLLEIIPADKHPDPPTFATFAIIRLFKIVFDIQFKARQNLLDEARQFIDFIGNWLQSPALHFECLLNSIIKQDRGLGFKMRKEAHDKLLNCLNVSSLVFDENLLKVVTNGIKKLGTHLGDPDEATRSAIANAIEGLAKKSGLTSWMALIPFEFKLIMENHLARNLCTAREEISLSPAMNKIQVDSPIKESLQDINLNANPISPSKTMQIDEVILDAELGISMKVRSRQPTAPVTPISRIKVDFDTPRSMDHRQTIDSDNETEGNIAESDKEDGEITDDIDAEDYGVPNEGIATDITFELLGLQ